MNTKIVILGSTGSVGRQTAEVAADLGVEVIALAASRDIKTMETQARRFKPRFVTMSDERAAAELKIQLADTDIDVRCGRESLLESASQPDADIIFNSIGQSAGLEPTLSALSAGKRLALANKESIVIAGELVMRTAKESGGEIIPVDSEHSAIYQCLAAGRRADVSRLLLTASGGPFYGMKPNQLEAITPAQALAHPTWKMGQKITIDSATLMNKGFEVIEAMHLFGVAPDSIEVLIHRESIIHSMVEYTDNAVIAQLSLPDMRLCAQYAMTAPERVPGLMQRLDLTEIVSLTFAKPDYESFPLLRLAYDCAKEGGVLPAVLNAADEVAVSQFLDGYIGFGDISRIVKRVVAKIPNKSAPSLSELKAASDEAVLEAAALCKSLH
ncbi:MAG TPA: 1-deoxy-D-xylulose-5-phosphate reductoisomerase [Firmicutes bacterium]|nr:1-deoxy-D-xylulose-5-phosphate reductoisomerase [Bacillota bacterium]